MGIKLKNSPIIEAVCEFRFEDKFEDLIVYGNLHEKFKSKFPKTRKATSIDLVLENTAEGIKQRTQEKGLQQFLSEDEQSLIQVGPNILTVNKLKPYESWDAFYPNIEFALKSFLEIADLKIIKRIGLRYINLINMKNTEIKIEDYYKFRPFCDSLCDSIKSFIVGIQIPKNEDHLRVTLTNAQPIKDFQMAHSLDFDYFSAKFTTEDIKKIMDWVQNAHGEIENAFFECITDKLIKEFE